MSWKEVEISCGFGSGEETTRFGPRQETGSSLYQVDTQACISNKNLEDGKLCLLSASCAERMALVIQSSVFIFDESCTHHLCTLEVESLIDAIAWDEHGDFIVFADRSGFLNFAHVDSQNILFSKRVAKGCIVGKCFASAHFVQQPDGLVKLILTTTDGNGLLFSNIDLEDLKQAIQSKDAERASQINSGMKVSQFHLNECHSKVESVSLTADNQSLFVAGQGDFGMSEWTINEGENIFIQDFCQIPDVDFIKVKETPDLQYIVVLDSNNEISLWSRSSKFLIDSWETETKVEDFSLFLTSALDQNDKNSKAKEDLKILLLTSPNESKKRELIVLSLPNFEHVYTLAVSDCAVLAVLPIQQDNMMFIEGIPNENLDDSIDGLEVEKQVVATVRVRSLMEAIPQNRFSRLLHKKKFTEAEEFAKSFNLDVDLVHKVHSMHILEKFSPWNHFQAQDEQFYATLVFELKACLDKLEDMEHIVDCCLKAQLPTLNATYDLLNYAQQRVNFKARTFTESSQLFQALLDGINRLVTFEVAFGQSHFTGTTWYEFLSSSLLEEVMKCFSRMEITAGVTIWRRHQSEFASEITVEKINKILNSFPPKTPSSKMVSWLREDFVPYVLTVLPEGQCVLAGWLEKMAKTLEFNEKEEWPHNALELAEVMYKAFSNISHSSQVRGVATPMQFATKVCKLNIPYFEDATDAENNNVGLSNAMSKLGKLVKSLREVLSLHQEYNCKLSMNQYLSENTKKITFRLLDRIAAAELISQTIKKYVKPYVTKNNMKLDNILFEYLVDFLEANNLSSLWESKVIAIVNEIETKELRCEATLKLMKKAVTPWSSAINTLIETTLKNFPDNEKLAKQYNYSVLQKKVAAYKIRETNFADGRTVERVIKFMLMTNKEDALQDALEICNYFTEFPPAYVFFIQIKTWITQDKVLEACNLLRTMSAQEACNVARSYLVWCNNFMPPVDQEDRDEQMKITEGSMMVLKTVCSNDKSLRAEFETEITILRNIYCLQNEFATFISATDYEDGACCKKLLLDYFQKEQQKDCAVIQSEYKNTKKELHQRARIIRFGELLDIKGFELEKILVEHALQTGDYDTAFKATCELLRPDTDTPSMYLSSASKRLNLFKRVAYTLITTTTTPSSSSDTPFDWVGNAQQLHLMAAQAAALCHDDELCDSLCLSSLLKLVDTVASQCEISEYQDDPKKNEGLINEWISDEYKDDSLVLSSADVLPLLQNILNLCIADKSEKPLYMYDSTRLSGNGVQCQVLEKEGSSEIRIQFVELTKNIRLLSNMLDDNNQQQLALQLLMLGIHTSAQHAANIQMGIPTNIEKDAQMEETDALVQYELKAAQQVLVAVETILTQSCETLVQTILSHRVVDHGLALSYLDTLTQKDGQRLFVHMRSKFGNKYTRMQVIAKVGVDFAALRNNANMKSLCQALKESAFWGRKLQLLRVPPPWDIYSVNKEREERQRILEIIVQHKDIELQDITAYCRAFNYSSETAIFLFITKLLLPSSSGDHGEADSVPYQEKIEQAINELANFEKLEAVLKGSISKVSPYDYERLIFIFNKIKDITESEALQITCEENVRILDMLTKYKRTAKKIYYNLESATMTDEFEEEQILCGKVVTPEIVKQRLPFHQLIKSDTQFTIIEAELTSEKNLIQIEEIAKALKIDTDNMIAKAVQKIAGAMFDQKEKKFQFSSVENVLKMIKNHHVMIAAAKWLAKYLPRGSEKTKVLEAIVKRMDEYVKEVTEDPSIEVDRAEVARVQQKYVQIYKRVSIEAALLEYGITDERFFVACSEPGNLVLMLYEEYGDKAKFLSGKLTGVPEVYELSKIITQTHGGISIDKIQMYLLKKWLPALRISSGHEEEEIMLSTSNEETIRQENERNLARCIYLLASSFSYNHINVLLEDFYKEDKDVSNMCRIRAMQVLLTLVDLSTVKKHAKFDVSQLKENLVSCVYLAELENLHIQQTEEAFAKCNKEALVRGLWRNHSREPQGIRLIADICLDYKIFDPKLWNSLLLKILSFDMMAYLKHVLLLISGVLELREIPSLTKMWRAIVVAPFNSVSTPLAADDEKSCLQASHLLTRCPVVLDIGLGEISDAMKKSGLYAQSLFCTKLIPDRDVRRQKINELLDDVGVEAVLTSVNRSRKLGEMDGTLAMIEEEVYKFVDRHGLFISLHGTAHFERMISYLVRNQNIKRLLVKIISAGKVRQALELVMLYAKAHPTSMLADKLNQGLSPKDALMFYLQDLGVFTETKKHLIAFFKAETGVDVTQDDTTSNVTGNFTGVYSESTFS